MKIFRFYLVLYTLSIGSSFAWVNMPGPCNCRTSEEMQIMTRDELHALDPKLSETWERNGGRLFMTLEQFISEFKSVNSSSTVNSECIEGMYARYIIGLEEGLPDEPENYTLFITGTYSYEEILKYNEKNGVTKHEYYSSNLLPLMCYRSLMKNAGWISIAEWYKLTKGDFRPSIRMTDLNYGFQGRITYNGEGLEKSGSQNFSYRYLLSNRARLEEKGIGITTDIRGPNFPSEGYRKLAGDKPYELRQMTPEGWEVDINKKYYYQILNTSQYDISLDFPWVRNDLLIEISPQSELMFDQKKINTAQLFGNYLNYVMDCMGNFYYMEATPTKIMSHSQPLGGAAVLCAGHMDVKDGIIECIHSSSEHYKPLIEHLDNAVDYIQKHTRQRLEMPHPHFSEPWAVACKCRETPLNLSVATNNTLSKSLPQIISLTTSSDPISFVIPPYLSVSNASNSGEATCKLKFMGPKEGEVTYRGYPSNGGRLDFVSLNFEGQNLTEYNKRPFWAKTLSLEIQENGNNGDMVVSTRLSNCPLKDGPVALQRLDLGSGDHENVDAMKYFFEDERSYVNDYYTTYTEYEIRPDQDFYKEYPQEYVYHCETKDKTIPYKSVGGVDWNNLDLAHSQRKIEGEGFYDLITVDHPNVSHFNQYPNLNQLWKYLKPGGEIRIALYEFDYGIDGANPTRDYTAYIANGQLDLFRQLFPEGGDLSLSATSDLEAALRDCQYKPPVARETEHIIYGYKPITRSSQLLRGYSNHLKMISVHPNPAKDMISINFQNELSHGSVIELFNLQGRSVYKETIYEGNTSVKIDVSKFPRGIYLLRTSSNGSTVYDEKIVLDGNGR